MSLFDKPKEQLSPALFTPDEKLKPEVRLYIFEDINKILTPGLVVGVYLLGSMAGRQYSDTSDIDINLILRDGLNRDNYKEHVKKYNERLLPGTNHPLNYHVQDYSEPDYKGTSEYAVYDLVHDVWAVPPKSYAEIRDPEKEFKDELEYARLYAKKLDYKHDRQALYEILERRRKQAYSFGWGTPRESQQNILYKYLEKLLKPEK